MTDIRGPSRIPWYDSFPLTGTRGVYSHGSDPAANAPVTNVDFNVADTPRLWGTDSMNLTIGAETKSVDRFAIVFDLKLYLAVRTK